MPKITDKELEKKLVHLFKEDLDFLREQFSGTIGVNKAIRSIIHSFVAQTSAQANATIDEIESLELVSEEAE